MHDVTTILKMLRAAPDGFAPAVGQLPVDEIRLLIDKADSLYYRPGLQPLLTDAEYDLLRPALRLLAPTDPILDRVGAPYAADEIGTKVPHSIPMGSLDNTDDGILGFVPWLTNIGFKLNSTDLPVMASLKVDGASICATYVDGRLVRVASRGNGFEGEDITVNAANFRNLPTILPVAINADVRGEAILYKADFMAVRSRDAGVPFDQIPEADRGNPRNDGNGIMGRHDGQDSDKLRLLAFNLIVPGTDYASEADKFAALAELGFKVVPHELCPTPAAVQSFYDKVAAARDDFPFEIDGVVVVLNSTAHQKFFITDERSRLRPRHSRAVKFGIRVSNTKLIDVLLTVGHTRMIIPTGVVETVRVGGVNVSNVLLNNWDEIKRLDVAIGDTVAIGLAGDIIPKCINVVSKGTGRQPILEPLTCPSCSAPTTRALRGNEGACTYCTNPACPAAAFAKLDCWIGSSKKGVGILDIGGGMIKALWANKMLADPADLYTLTAADIKDVVLGKGARIGLSRAEKIVANINGKRKLPLHTFLGSLGIELLGRRRVQILREAAAGQLDRLEDWLDTAKLATIQIPGFGDAVRAAVVQGIEDNRVLIQKLLANGVTVAGGTQTAPNVEATENGALAAPPAQLFAGLSFCLTGTRAYQDEIVQMGGTLKSGVSKGLDFLVQLDATSKSNKTLKAEEYGTQIISVDYLKQALDGQVILRKREVVAQ